VHACRTLDRNDAPEGHGAVGAGGESESVAAFNDGVVVREPTAAPDEAGVLVLAAPHKPLREGDRVDAAAANQRCEEAVSIPAGKAQPAEVSARTNERATFPVGQQGILAQHMRDAGLES
jgi:hypothetical protein